MNERRNRKYESLNGMEKKGRGRILTKSCFLHRCLMKKLKSALGSIVRTSYKVV